MPESVIGPFFMTHLQCAGSLPAALKKDSLHSIVLLSSLSAFPTGFFFPWWFRFFPKRSVEASSVSLARLARQQLCSMFVFECHHADDIHPGGRAPQEIFLKNNPIDSAILI